MCVYVISENDHALFLQRKEDDPSAYGPDQDKEPSCGHIDKRETPRKAAARELREETSIKVNPSELIYLETGWIPGCRSLRGGVARYVLYLDETHENIPLELLEHKGRVWVQASPEMLAKQEGLPIDYQKCTIRARRKLVKRGLLH
ncbi:NUDIX hydrolase [Shimazuella soli]|uniref:NUDIX hydrolase n=1 Tax=Shimazuella soli TaxID=1892854 RepID=UPI003B830D93